MTFENMNAEQITNELHRELNRLFPTAIVNETETSTLGDNELSSNIQNCIYSSVVFDYLRTNSFAESLRVLRADYEELLGEENEDQAVTATYELVIALVESL